MVSLTKSRVLVPNVASWNDPRDIKIRAADVTLLVKNKATKLLKIQRSVPESDKTIPIQDSFGSCLSIRPAGIVVKGTTDLCL